MVTDLEPPQTGFTIPMFLIDKKQQIIWFPRKKLLQKNRGSLNSLWLRPQQAAIPDTSAGAFTASSASPNRQFSTLNWEEGKKKQKYHRPYSGEVSQFITSESKDHCYGYLVRQSVFLWSYQCWRTDTHTLLFKKKLKNNNINKNK